MIDYAALQCYQTLLETTQLQTGYQSLIALLKTLHNILQSSQPELEWNQQLVENRMDFAYMQARPKQLKAKGLKLQIVFVHERFQFEVWLSGYNRKIQQNYTSSLRQLPLGYELTKDPLRIDYIVKTTLPQSLVYEPITTLQATLETTIAKMYRFGLSL
ncbi:MAG: DUF7000 family protein [Erysipelotrichaceae bacterium]